MVDFAKIQYRAHRPQGRSPNTSQQDRQSLTASRAPAGSQASLLNDKLVAPEVRLRQYRAVESGWTTDLHNKAMQLALDSRPPGAAITPVLELYNHLFERDNLRPNMRSYEIIIRAFALKDKENTDRKRYLENRVRKKRSAIGALGKWAVNTQNDDFALDEARHAYLHT